MARRLCDEWKGVMDGWMGVVGVTSGWMDGVLRVLGVLGVMGVLSVCRPFRPDLRMLAQVPLLLFLVLDGLVGFAALLADPKEMPKVWAVRAGGHNEGMMHLCARSLSLRD